MTGLSSCEYRDTQGKDVKTYNLDEGGSSTSLPSRDSDDTDVDPNRGNWVGKLDFIMSCVSYAIGLGNIWRFPYLCYRNGGAVFLIPYLFFLILCGMPLFFVEVIYGQFASLSPITIWRLSPLFKGIGYGMVLISGIVCIYYNIIITWTLYYLFHSFYPVLPWSTCGNWWNTERCASYEPDHGIHGNLTLNGTDFDYNPTSHSNVSGTIATLSRKSPSEEFWENKVLQISEGIENLGGIRWELLGCLAFAWIIVFLSLIKGVKSSGKVVYFTATFPYVVLLVLLVRAVTLPGATEGLKFYVIPKWEKLLEPTVWGEAAMQIFYSVGAAWGALITMASYNRFNNNCYRDACIVPVLDCATSIFAGFVIFSIIGFMAYETGSSIDNVITQGPGLVFVVYPEAVARFPLSQIWAVMFFLMLFSVGIGSQMAMFQTVTSAFIDEFDWLKNKKVLFTGVLCLFEFLMGIPCVTRGGIYYLQIMDWYSSTFSLMVISFTELIVICWIYGVERFYKDIELMIGFRPCIWWRILWSFITPILILCILLFSIGSHTPVTYGDYSYPAWAIGLGWVFALCSMVPIPLVAIIKVARHQGPILQRLKDLTQPSSLWGPALDKHRKMYLASLNQNNDNFDVVESLTAAASKEERESQEMGPIASPVHSAEKAALGNGSVVA